MKQVYYSIPNF